MKKKYRKLCAYGVFSLLCLKAIHVQAQLKDCNAFLQGNYVEIGVNYNGAYGSSAPAPSGYHGNTGYGAAKLASCTSTGTESPLGFVADPDKDGWTVSAPGQPVYMGDYFLPGSPQEGWSIMTSTGESNCWNTGAGGLGVGMTGGNVRHFVSGSKVVTEWEGVYDSLSIMQRTILDKANTYFVIRVKIKNLAHSVRHNIYYLRTVDPDNDELWPLGSYVTNNKIEFQNPDTSNLSVVSATGTAGYTNDYLALGAKDPRAKCFIMKSGLVPTTRLDSLYMGDTSKYIYAADSLYLNDVGIGLLFKIDSLPSVDSTIIHMAYMFAKSDITDAPEDDGSLPGEIPTSIASQSLNHANIKIAPNPFQNTLLVTGLEKTDQINMLDMNGAVIKQTWINNGNGWELNTSNLPTGIYILTVLDQSGVTKLRQVVQHN